jgi:hypothetical protein
MQFSFKEKIVNNASHQNMLLFIFCILLYNFRILIRYHYSHTFFNECEYAYLAITYQKCGFISRGLMPSIYEAVGLNNKLLLYLLSNVYVATTAFSVIQIGKYYKNIFFSVAVLLSSFGILHQTTLLLKPDQVVYMLFFVSYLCLIKGYTKCFFLISLISMFVHEVSVFLFIPIYFLQRKNNFSFYAYSFIMLLLFILIAVGSTKISANTCIELMKNYTGLQHIPKEFYYQRVLGIRNNIQFYFTVNNLALSFLLFVVLLIFNYLIFKINYVYKGSFLNYLFLFPLILSFVAIDWMRWISMVYILSIFYLQYQNKLNFIIAKRLLLLSLCIGIPVTINLIFSPLMLFLKIVFLSIYTLVH